MTGLSAADFDCFAAGLQDPASAARLAAETGLPSDHACIYLAAMAGEAHVALRLLERGGLRPGHRVLEVGAGAGLLTAYLQSRGLDLVAIDPGGAGFPATPALARIAQETTGVAPRIWPLAARELDPASHGLFDLIFSVNVIEHFQPLDENLAGLARVMSSDCVQVHTCPNYIVPYEPHYRIPLVPFAPRLTPYVWRWTMRNEPLWSSLNFITSADLRAYAARHGLALTFESGTMAAALQRLLDEPAFSDRHPPLLRRAAGIAAQIGLIALVRKLPAKVATPMTVRLRRLPGHAAELE